jgi:hypothetical protein
VTRRIERQGKRESGERPEAERGSSGNDGTPAHNISTSTKVSVQENKNPLASYQKPETRVLLGNEGLWSLS